MNYKKPKRTTKLQKKQYELDKKRTLIRKQNGSNEEIKQNEKKKQKRETLIREDIDLVRFFELALSDKTYVTTLNLHEIKNELLLDYTTDFE